MRSLLLPIVLAVSATGLLPSPAAAQASKVGVINLQRALLDTAEIKKASNDLQRKFKPRQDALEKIQQEIGDIQTQLQASQGKLSPAGQAELESRGQRRQREGQRLSEDLQADVERERNEVLQRAGTRMNEIVKKIAEEKGLDMVVDQTNTVYFKAPLEITDAAIAAYDKAYPVK
jgi:outer membrane protein